jgi:hypothetical protein
MGSVVLAAGVRVLGSKLTSAFDSMSNKKWAHGKQALHPVGDFQVIFCNNYTN